MTGFGRAAAEGANGLAVEIRSVNHRHLDLVVRVPRMLSALEPALKDALAGRFARGKVEVIVSQPPGRPIAQRVELSPAVAEQYREFARALGADDPLRTGELLSLPGVARVVEEEITPDALREPLVAAALGAAEGADAMRRREGEALERELRERLANVTRLVDDIAGRADGVVDAARKRLRKRAEQLRDETGVLDEARLHQEVVFAADRLDVTEELVRLRSHTTQFERALDDATVGEPLGRRLDFLLQELSREANTIGSKAGDAEVAHRVVDLKTELERIREQVQNVE